MRTTPPNRSAIEPRVVIAEPDDDTRALYVDYLRAAGFDVVEALDGREALVRCLAQPPAVVLIERRMPFIDGVALCDLLRRDQATAMVPIIVLTTDTQPEALTRLRLIGASAILSKPVSVEVVVNETVRLCDAGHAPVAKERASRDGTGQKRGRTLSRTLPRYQTTDPPSPPPVLSCPSCVDPLDYKASRIGGVSDRYPEQWDEFVCRRNCGVFEYRHRTRRLRRTA